MIKHSEVEKGGEGGGGWFGVVSALCEYLKIEVLIFGSGLGNECTLCPHWHSSLHTAEAYARVVVHHGLA